MGRRKNIVIILILLFAVLLGYAYLQLNPANDIKRFEESTRVLELSDSTEQDVSEESAPTQTGDLNIYIGQEVGAMTVKEFAAFRSGFSEMNANNAQVFFDGAIAVTGKYEYIFTEFGFEGYCMSDFDAVSLDRLPYLLTVDGTKKVRYGFCFRNEDVARTLLGVESRNITVVIDKYELNSYPSEVVDRADLVQVVSE